MTGSECNPIIPNVFRLNMCICLAAGFGTILAGCGGSGGAPDTTAQLSQAQGVASPPARTNGTPGELGKPPAASMTTQAVSPQDSTRFARLKTLALLAPLSEREKAALFEQLKSASPSERLGLINGYPKLESLPDRQKELLLGQMENIVAITTAAQQLACQCGNEIKREICVRESCANRSELQSLCNQACGTLGSFGMQCAASPKCPSR